MFNIGITVGLEGGIMSREESLDKTLVNTPQELQLQHRSNHMLPKILKVTVHGTLFRGPGNVHRRLRETCLARGPGRARRGFFHFPLPVPERGWGPPKRRWHRTVTWVRPYGRVRHNSAWPALSKRPEEASPRTATKTKTPSGLLTPSLSRFVSGAGRRAPSSLMSGCADGGLRLLPPRGVRTWASSQGHGRGAPPMAPRASMGHHGLSISENACWGGEAPPWPWSINSAPITARNAEVGRGKRGRNAASDQCPLVSLGASLVGGGSGGGCARTAGCQQAAHGLWPGFRGEVRRE